MIKYEEVLKLFGGRESFIEFHKQALGRMDDFIY
jgi:hypothetical protein